MSEVNPRRARRSRAQWQELIDEHTASGLSVAAFCHAKGLSPASFHNWKRRLAKSEPDGTWLDLSRLSERGAAPGWEIELALGDGLCLRLRRC